MSNLNQKDAQLEDEHGEMLWYFTAESKCSELNVDCEAMQECTSGACRGATKAQLVNENAQKTYRQ